MDAQKMGALGVGSRLVVGNETILTIGDTDLVISGASAKKKQSRSSCAPLSSGKTADGKIYLAFYNILWAEVTKGRLEIEYAQPKQKSAHQLERKIYTYEAFSDDVTPTGQPHADAFASVIMERAYGTSIRQKRAYVLVNPNSGPGGAIHKWEKEARPIFEGARMQIDTVTLEHGGEATDLVERMDIEKYDTVVACSGDGTPYEIFNGLAKRKDARKALGNIAVSHIPCGSGNAMSNNWNGTNYPGPAALAIVKGHITPLDLSSITQGDRRLVTVLSQALGIMAEADLMTENLRWMGKKRFEVGLVQRVFQKKAYPCDLAIKLELEGKEDIKAYYKRLLKSNGLAREMERPTEDGYDKDDTSEGLPRLRYGTINDPIPEGWEVLKLDTIGNFFAGNLPFVTEKSSFFPAALPCDGCQDVITIDAKIPVHKAAMALMETETPKFFDNPSVTYRKVSAYRITPRNQVHGCISIDGESIPFEPYQLEVHRGLARVLTKHGRFEAPGPLGWEKVQD